MHSILNEMGKTVEVNGNMVKRFNHLSHKETLSKHRIKATDTVLATRLKMYRHPHEKGNFFELCDMIPGAKWSINNEVHGEIPSLAYIADERK